MLKDSPASRHKLSIGCKGYEGTLKDLDMPFLVKHFPAPPSPSLFFPSHSRPHAPPPWPLPADGVNSLQRQLGA